MTQAANSGNSAKLTGLRIEVEEHKTYWIEEKPEGWTNQEWAETVAAAKRGEKDHEGIEAILPLRAYIIEEDFDIDHVEWETV